MKVIDILLVEDNPGDARLVIEAMRSNRFHANFSHVKDGEEAMAFLRREPPFTDANRPGLILLDLNMPRKDGREVLREIKADPALRTIPVVVLTTSEAETDIVQSYMQHASCFLAKPVDFDEFIRVIRLLGEFWLTAVRLP